jgi:uncharacterized protein (DUF2141 family)
MNIKVILIFLVATSLFAGELTVNIQNLKSNHGTIQVALWNTHNGFPTDYTTSYDTQIIEANKTSTAIFRDLRPGTYAIAAFHDKNNDEQLNTNAIGAPIEGFGFSNNPKIYFGPPSFKKARFTIKATAKKNLSIRLKHF